MNDVAKPHPAQRLYSIQGLRGLAVLMVMSVHLFELEKKYWAGERWMDTWVHFNGAAVDLFLVISGFVLTYLAVGHFGDRRYLHSYAYARVTRVYPAYMIYTAVLVPVFLWNPAMFNAADGHQVNLLRSMLLLPDDALPLIPVAWTLHYELYFYIVLGLMLLLPERRLPQCMLAWLAATVLLVGIGSMTPVAEQGAFQKVLVSPINLEFILGMAAALRVSYGTVREARWCLAAAALGIVIGYGSYVSRTGDHWVDPYWRVVIAGVPAALLTYACVILERDRRWVFAKPLVWIGDAAYSIYLTHIMTMSLFGKIWSHLELADPLSHVLFLAASLAVGLAAGKLCFDHIETPVQRFARRHDPFKSRTPIAAERSAVAQAKGD